MSNYLAVLSNSSHDWKASIFWLILIIKDKLRIKDNGFKKTAYCLKRSWHLAAHYDSKSKALRSMGSVFQQDSVLDKAV